MRDLVERAKRGDENAFAELVYLIGDRLYAVARRILQEPSRADDALQQALVAIWRDLPTLRDLDRFEAWSYRVLVRCCYEEVSQARRWAAQIHVLRVEPVADETAGVLDRDRIEHGFRRLTPEQRAAVVLHFYLGLTTAETAETLGIAAGTVSSRLHYALRVLRAAIEADERPALAKKSRA